MEFDSQFSIPLSQYMINEMSKLNPIEENGDNTNYKNLMFAEYIEQISNIDAFANFKKSLILQNHTTTSVNQIHKPQFAAKFSKIISDLTPIFDPADVVIGSEMHPFTKIGITYEMFKNSHIKDTTFTDLPSIITKGNLVSGKWENPCIISRMTKQNTDKIRILLRTIYDRSFVVTENTDGIQIILASRTINHMFGYVSFTRVMTVLQNNDIVINNVWKVIFTQ